MSAAPSVVLGLTSTRGCGKDTLYQLLYQLDRRFVRLAFADSLKADLGAFLHEQFGLDVWTVTGAAKELIRPILISYGMAQRYRDPDHWAKKVVRQIEKQSHAARAAGLGYIPVVTDVRFASEVALMNKEYGDRFRLVNLTRHGSPPPTDEEEKHYRTIATLADYHLAWGNDDEQSRLARAREVLAWLGIATTVSPS